LFLVFYFSGGIVLYFGKKISAKEFCGLLLLPVEGNIKIQETLTLAGQPMSIIQQAGVSVTR
jgi:hypothetical protein